MMKNLLLTLFTVLLASASFSQLDLAAKLMDPVAGSTVTSDNVTFTLRVINKGTVDITATDQITIAITLDGGAFTSLTNTAAVILAGDSLTFSEVDLNFAGHPTTATSHTMCVAISAAASLGTDADLSNNSECYTLNRSLAGVDEKTINDEVSVFVSFGVLNMSSTVDVNYSYSVMSISGQVISQGNFANNRQIDMTGVAKGIYAVVITNGTERITKKIAIQ